MVNSKRNILRRIPGLAWGIAAVLIFFCIFAKNFFMPQNLLNNLGNASILLVVSCGMTLAILSEQIDMSIGGVMSCAAMATGYYMNSVSKTTFGNVIIACFIGIGIGALFGIVNGIMIGKFRFNYWLVTFSTMEIGYGLSEVINDGRVISGFDKTFRNLSGGKIAGIVPTVVIPMLPVLVIMLYLCYSTKFGMHLYAVGDSEICAKQSGIGVIKIRFIIYLISGILSGLGGVLLVARTNSASPSIANGYEFNAMAATIIGGTSFSGGEGGIAGTIVGALIMTLTLNGLQLLGLSNYWQQVFQGVFIFAIIIIDVISEKRKKIMRTRRIYKS